MNYLCSLKPQCLPSWVRRRNALRPPLWSANFQCLRCIPCSIIKRYFKLSTTEHTKDTESCSPMGDQWTALHCPLVRRTLRSVRFCYRQSLLKVCRYGVFVCSRICRKDGRVGRLIMFKECLAHGIVPFIITDDLKMFYYRGLSNWPAIPGYLRDICLTAQDSYRSLMEYFRIE